MNDKQALSMTHHWAINRRLGCIINEFIVGLQSKKIDFLVTALVSCHRPIHALMDGLGLNACQWAAQLMTLSMDTDTRQSAAWAGTIGEPFNLSVLFLGSQLAAKIL